MAIQYANKFSEHLPEFKEAGVISGPSLLLSDLARGSIHNVVITKSWTDKKITVNIERLSAFQSHRQMNLETTFGKLGRFLVIDLNHAVHHFQIDKLPGILCVLHVMGLISIQLPCSQCQLVVQES